MPLMGSRIYSLILSVRGMVLNVLSLYSVLVRFDTAFATFWGSLSVLVKVNRLLMR